MAAFDELLVITDPDQLAFTVNPASYVAGVEEILINTTTKKISLKVVGNLKIHGATIKAVYSKLKDAWRTDTTLIKFPFPMGPITDEQFEMINGWNWDITGSTGITVSTATWASTNGGEITFTTGAAHGISVGDVITVAGITPSGYNDTYVTIAGTTGSTIVVANLVDPGTYTSGGTVVNYLLTTDLLRTGGWSVVPSAGVVDEYWSSCITLGTLGTTDQVYYQQLTGEQASVNFKLTGKVNQAVRIYYFDGTGTRPDISALTDSTGADGYVFRRYLKLFVREWQKIYAQSEIADIGVSQLTYQAYRFPLTNSTDLKVTHSELFVSAGANIGSISGNGTIVTVNTAVAHGLITGDYVDIIGTVAYNGNYQITYVDVDTFTYLSAVNTGSETIGTARKGVYGNVDIKYLRDANNALYVILGDATAGSYVVGEVVRDSQAIPRWFKCTTAGTADATDILNLGTMGGAGTAVFTAYEGERLIGTSYYAFSTIIDADNSVAPEASGSARTAEIYESVQYQLRQNSDIDISASGTVTGKTASSLLRFVGDTLVTSNGVYIDSFNTQDTNAIEYYDWSGLSRTFPYVAALTVNFGTNLQDDQYAKYWVFFTTGTAGNYGTANAVLVQDKDGTVMGEELASDASTPTDHRINPLWVTEGSPIKRTFATHSYNYDSNDQRGGGTYNSGDGVGDTAKSDAPITVVGIGLSTGQYVTATGNIARSTANSVTLTASLERNYSKGASYP